MVVDVVNILEYDEFNIFLEVVIIRFFSKN